MDSIKQLELPPQAKALLRKGPWWPLLAMVVALLLQIAIIRYWEYAKWGTIVTILLLVAGALVWAVYRFEQVFVTDVKWSLATTGTMNGHLITEADIAPLPAPVQQYIRYSGALNRPRLRNMRIVFEGKMRSKGKEWFPFTTVQYNFFANPTRLFFMKARMFGITAQGYHRYENEKALMDIRLLGLLSITKAQGDLMNKAETVTLFNDMCLLAPGSLIDKRIQWEPIDPYCAKAVFTNGAISITAMLYFNGQAQLVNFVCDERYDVNDKQAYRFSTPVMEYIRINGYNVMQKGSAVWHYPDGAFEYGQFILKDIAYNVNE